MDCKDKSYVVFLLVYDTSYFQDNYNAGLPDCDDAYQELMQLAEEFLTSEYNTDEKSLYDCFREWYESEIMEEDGVDATLMEEDDYYDEEIEEEDE